MRFNARIELVAVLLGLIGVTGILPGGCTLRATALETTDAGAGNDAAVPGIDASNPVDAGADDAGRAGDAGRDADVDGGWIPGHRVATADDVLAVTCVPEAIAACSGLSWCGCEADSGGEDCAQEHSSLCARSRAPVVSGIHVRIDAFERCVTARVSAIGLTCSPDVIPAECQDFFASAAGAGMSCGRLSGAAGFPVSCAGGAGRCVASFGAGFSCRPLVARGESCVGPEGEELPCAPGDACVNGVCAADDGSCRRTADCAGGICADARCGEGAGEVGASCSSRADCRLGLVCEAGACAMSACDPFCADCCAAGTECSPAPGTTCRRFLTAGQSCLPLSDPPCARGLVCRSTSLTSTETECQPPLADGESCSDSADCASGLCLDSVCIALGVAGERCHSESECASPLRCRAARCAEGASAGVSCEESDDCARGLRCASANGGARVCSPLPGEGEPCPDSVCDAGLWCDGVDSPVCRRAPGSGCTQATDCPAGFGCIEGECRTCAPGCGDDEYCTQATQCTPTLCSLDEGAPTEP